MGAREKEITSEAFVGLCGSYERDLSANQLNATFSSVFIFNFLLCVDNTRIFFLLLLLFIFNFISYSYTFAKE